MLRSSSAAGYQWLKDGVIISGATADSFQATAAGQYSVSIKTNGGCTSVSSAITVSVNPVPPLPTITTGGNTTFCTGGSVSLSSSSSTGNQWFKDGTAISGATGTIFQASSAGQYSVRVTSAGGCVSVTANQVTVNVTPNPLKPVISWNGNRFSAPTGFAGYRWFRDGIEIAGAETENYQPQQSGLFKVTVRDANNCSATSDEFNLVVTGIADLRVGDVVISYYPNPAREAIYINVSNLQAFTLKAQLYDLHGRLMIDKVISSSRNTLSTEHLPSGIYQLLITNGKEKLVIKILLLKDN